MLVSTHNCSGYERSPTRHGSRKSVKKDLCNVSKSWSRGPKRGDLCRQQGEPTPELGVTVLAKEPLHREVCDQCRWWGMVGTGS